MDQPDRTDTTGRWTIVTMLLAVAVFANVDRQILNVVVEPVKAEFGLSDKVMGLLTGAAFSVFYAVLGVPLAMLADRSNRRNLIAAAIAVWSAMTVFCGMAATAAQLILARIGVAVGEAGAGPASQSIVSDLFAPRERALPMAILATGTNIGILFGFVAGGLLSAAFGWRWAFVAVGVPGLLMAIVILAAMREPRRGLADNVTETEDVRHGLGHLLGLIARRRALLWIIAGFTCAGMFGYGAIAWMTAFFHRSYGLDAGQIAPIIGLLVGIGGAVGSLAGGFLADRTGTRDVRWRLWIICIVAAIAAPLALGAFLARNQWLTLALMVFPASVAIFHAGPSFALVQELVPLRLRALAAAFLLFCLNVIGGGFGPFLVGLLSDLLEPSLGRESLRYAMMALTVPIVLSGIFYYLASRRLPRDLAEAHAG
ncbi:MAG: spinster family MFS transporter [Sphingomonadales bacterium]